MQSPSCKYHLPKEREVFHSRVTSRNDLIDLINAEGAKEINAICENIKIFDLWSEFYCDESLKFECDLNMYNEDVMGFKIMNEKNISSLKELSIKWTLDVLKHVLISIMQERICI